MDWQTFFMGYFLVSFMILGWAIYIRKLLGMKDEHASFKKTVSFLLFAPILLLAHFATKLLYPASGDQISIIYGKLSYAEGKTQGELLAEIHAAGERLGGNETRSFVVTIKSMISIGYARQEVRHVSIKDAFLVFLDGSTKTLDDLAKVLPPGTVNMNTEAKQAMLEELEKNSDFSRPIGTEVLYFKGEPPRRRRRLKEKLIRHWGWQPAPTRA